MDDWDHLTAVLVFGYCFQCSAVIKDAKSAILCVFHNSSTQRHLLTTVMYLCMQHSYEGGTFIILTDVIQVLVSDFSFWKKDALLNTYYLSSMSEADEVFKASSKIFLSPFPNRKGLVIFSSPQRPAYGVRNQRWIYKKNSGQRRCSLTTEEKKRLYTHRDKNQHNAPLSKTCILTDELATVEENGSAQHTI